MAASSLYIASIISAIGLYLVIRPGTHAIRVLGMLLGLGGLAAIVASIITAYGSPNPGESFGYLVVFGLIAVCGAGRMISHPKPVYAALYFVLVVVASAGLFLLMQAEFMAFALVIVYAGAILITYMFVLMLAQQAAENSDVEFIADYDRIPREPAGAVFAGFLMLAILSSSMFGPKSQLDFLAPPSATAAASQWDTLERLPRKLDEAIRAVEPRFESVIHQEGGTLSVHGSVADVQVRLKDGSTTIVTLGPDSLPSNTDLVGSALVGRFPVSLELAGVILLMAMFGAVVLARRQIEHSEDERREAAGMPRLYHTDDAPTRTSPAAARSTT